MRSRVLFGVLLLTTALTLVGCSGEQLIESADRLDDGAEKVRQVADRIEQGKADHADLLDAVYDYVPDSAKPQVDRVLNAAEDSPEAARDIADLMEDLADDFREQAELEASTWENTIVGGIGVAEALLGGGTIFSGLLAGFFRRKQKRAESVTEDVVTSIQSSETMRKAIDEGGGDDLRKSMSSETQRAVKKIKATT